MEEQKKYAIRPSLLLSHDEAAALSALCNAEGVFGQRATNTVMRRALAAYARQRGVVWPESEKRFSSG